MTQIIKWEFKKSYHTLKIIVLSYAVFLAVFNLIPLSFFSSLFGNTVDSSADSLMSIVVWVGIIYFYFFFPIRNMVTCFRPTEYYLEKPRQITYAKVFLAKTLVNFVSLILGSAIAFIGMWSISLFDTTVLTSSVSLIFLLAMVTFAVVIPMIAAFIAVVPVLSIFSEHRWIWRTLLALLFFFLFNSIDIFPMWIQVAVYGIAAVVLGGLAVYLADRRYEA